MGCRDELVADSFSTAEWSSRCHRFMLLCVVLVASLYYIIGVHMEDVGYF